MTGKHARLRPRWIKAGLGALGGASLAGAVLMVPQHMPHVQPLTPVQSPASTPGTQRLAETPEPTEIFSPVSAVESKILAHTPARITFSMTPTPLLATPVPAGIIRPPATGATPVPVRTVPLLLVPPPYHPPVPVTSPVHVPLPSVSPSGTATPSPWPTHRHGHRHHRVICSITP